MNAVKQRMREDGMEGLNAKTLAEILGGIFFLSLSFQTRLWSYLGMAFLLIISAVLHLLHPTEPGKALSVGFMLIFLLLFVVAFEGKKWEKMGKGVEDMVPSKSNKIFALVLFVIYMASRILYFDKVQ